MSIKTLRKRIAITATSTLVIGMLSVVSAPSSSAHSAVGGTNTLTNVGQVAGAGRAAGQTNNTSTEAGSLFVSIADNTTPAAVASVTAVTGACSFADDLGRSKGLLFKDSSSGIAQSASVLPGAQLSLYACTATAAAFIASAGTFSSASNGAVGASTWTYSSNNAKTWSPNITVAEGTSIGAIWTAPTTLGTYTVSLYTGFYTNSSGVNLIADATNGGTPETLSANITVSVVAATSGGSYNAGESFCKAVRGSTTTPANNIDDSGVVPNGLSWSIDFALNDAYGADLDTGNLAATATNGALLAFGTAGATPVAGTATTVTASSAGANSTVRVSQGTAGAPVTTTVTISYNGTVVCTKTVSIAGTVAALTIPAANVAVQDLSSDAGSSTWFSDATGRAGTFYVVATDSVGNRIATPATVGIYSADSATLGTIVTGVVFDSNKLASSTSSTSPLSATVARHSCAANAGTQAGVKIKFTLANGTVVTSAPVNLSCADNPSTVSASFDKAKYISGEVAKLTVSFKDSKGNAANNVTTIGASTISVPGMTLVSTTGSPQAVAGAGGNVVYTYTVGQNSGKYAAVVDFTGALVLSTVQNPSYEISTGGDTTTNADVLKSIVALIASINKQIQALQKLILRR